LNSTILYRRKHNENLKDKKETTPHTTIKNELNQRI